MKKYFSPTGNRTRITGTTILHDNHYTISDFVYFSKSILILIKYNMIYQNCSSPVKAIIFSKL